MSFDSELSRLAKWPTKHLLDIFNNITLWTPDEYEAAKYELEARGALPDDSVRVQNTRGYNMLSVKYLDEATLELSDEAAGVRKVEVEKRCTKLLLELSDFVVTQTHFVSRPEISFLDRIQKNRPIQGDTEAEWKLLCQLSGICTLCKIPMPDNIFCIKIIENGQIKPNAISNSPKLRMDLYSYDYTSPNTCTGFLIQKDDVELPESLTLSLTIPLNVFTAINAAIVKNKIQVIKMVVEVLAFEDGISIYLERGDTMKTQINSISYDLL